jgi:hypothetical protein
MEETFPKGARDKMCDLLCSTIRENEEFMWKHARAAYNEIAKLSTDSSRIMSGAPPQIQTPAGYLSSARAFFANHVLNPIGSGILSALLDGNIPACFMMLRLLLETLLTCWYADQKYGGLDQFDARLASVQDEKIRVSDICARLESGLKIDGVIIDQWRSLSSEWIHSPNQAGRFVDAIARKGSPPSWSLMIPISYVKEDVEFLEDLGKQIQKFRSTMRATFDTWPPAE